MMTKVSTNPRFNLISRRRLPRGTYLQLLDGRDTPIEVMLEGGEPGPLIGPLLSVAGRIGTDLLLEFCSERTGRLFFPTLGTSVDSGPVRFRIGAHLPIDEYGLVHYANKFWGEWRLFNHVPAESFGDVLYLESALC